MNKRTLIQSTVALVLVLAPLQFAQGDVFNHSVVLDLSVTSITDDTSGGHLILGNTTTPVAVAPFTPDVGDVLVTEVSFANGDRLRINNGPNVVDTNPPTFFESLTFFFDTDGSTSAAGFSATTSTATFFDLEGNLINSFGSTSGVLGQSIGSSAVDLTDSFISFTGLILTSTITRLGSGGDPYDSFGLFGGRAGGFEVIAGPASNPALLPTPSTALLVSLALLCLLLLGTRRDPAVLRRQPMA